IQGRGFESPIVGESVLIEGIVVGDFQEGDGDAFNTDLGGFYVQEEAADYDNDDATSEGIFVFAPDGINVESGDIVKVTGQVAEFNGLTQINEVSSIEIIGSSELPAPVAITLPATDEVLEAVEGMLVVFPQELVISEYFNFDRFGEIVLGLPMEGRELIFQPTSYLDPENEEAIQAALEYIENSTITLDDARTVQNPDPARHPNGEVFDLENLFRGGDLVQNAEGVLSFSFGAYRIQPTAGADYIAANPRSDQPEFVGGSLKVASFNVLNYFTSFGSRGADNATEFERQRAKIIAAISNINADIVGLIEIENNTEAIENLVSGLNAAMGEGTYDYINTGVIGTDAIKVAFIYKPVSVEPVGKYAVLTTDVDPRFIDTRNRPALAQTFREKETDQVLTVVVNHLKSKGSGCGAGDDDPYQGNCNLTRTQAAEALVDWLATDPTNSGDPDYMIIGDLNAYDKEDPIQAILKGTDDEAGTEDDYVDLLKAFEGEFAYTYVFDAQFGYLDYALVSTSLYEQISGATAWHINSEEPDILDYDITFKKDAQDALYQPNPYRSSDHDPVIVGLNLAPAVCTVEPSLPVRGRRGRTVYPKLVIFPAPVSDASGVTQKIKLLSFSENDELIVISKNPITATPKDGKTYRASEVFGEGEQINEGVFVIGKDNKWMSQYAVSGLEPSTRYYVAVFILTQGKDCGPNYLEEVVAYESFVTQKSKFYEDFEDLIDKLKDHVINVYPNPVNDVFYINIPSRTTQQVELLLGNFRGNVISLGKYNVKKGDNKLEIDVQHLQLPKNLYLLKVASHKQFYPIIRLSVE
ncbi:MAG: ExeM/NucH family extracellular endonuclease, partial [Cyclobacteriaceae bacterium]